MKDLARRTAADKILRDKAFNIAKDPKYDRYQRGLASMVYNFFDKKLQAVVLSLCQKMSSYLKKLINQLLEKLKKVKVH